MRNSGRQSVAMATKSIKNADLIYSAAAKFSLSPASQFDRSSTDTDADCY